MSRRIEQYFIQKDVQLTPLFSFVHCCTIVSGTLLKDGTVRDKEIRGTAILCLPMHMHDKAVYVSQSLFWYHTNFLLISESCYTDFKTECP